MKRRNFLGYSLLGMDVSLTSANSGIQSLADLKGKTVEMGKPTSTVRFLGGFKMLQDAGIDPLEDIEIVHSSNRGFDAIQAGEVDASIKYLTATNALSARMDSTPTTIPSSLGEKHYQAIFLSPAVTSIPLLLMKCAIASSKIPRVSSPRFILPAIVSPNAFAIASSFLPMIPTTI